MIKEDKTQNQLIADIAHDSVIQFAPKEEPFFRAISEAYFKDTEKTLKSRTGKSEKLGLEVIVLENFTNVILVITSCVVVVLKDEITKNIKEVISDIVKEIISRSGIEIKAKTNGFMQPTKEQLERVHKVTFDKGFQIGLSKEDAKNMADSVVGSLFIPEKS